MIKVRIDGLRLMDYISPTGDWNYEAIDGLAKALYDRYKDYADKLIAEADVICSLDFNALKRIDDMADAVVASPARKIMIDHHLYPVDFCKIVMSYPKISSTSE